MQNEELNIINNQVLDLTNKLIDLSQIQSKTAAEVTSKSVESTRNIMKMFCITLVIITAVFGISYCVTQCYTANQMYDYNLNIDNTNKNDNQNKNGSDKP